MDVKNLPSNGDILYLFNKKVIVIKAYEIFNLVKIRYMDEYFEFVVDICTLSKESDYKESISIGIFRRNYYE